MLFLFFSGGAGVVVAAGDLVGVPTGAAVVTVAAGAVLTEVVGVSGVEEERSGTGAKVTVFSRTRLLRFA